ncbi:MAG: recombination protein O N-terminal domain-containing protein [Nanoarchaeota archaeon]|nr:recombination protein O N-terminal domain-containing protein [Nanoarchaeota archaeon]
MSEYCTEAIVLGRRENGGGHNLFADLYTRELGRVEARVVSGRKITSKLSPHLDPGTLVFARLVHKNQFTLADTLLEERFSGVSGLQYENFSRLAHLFRYLFPFGVSDFDVWELLLKSLREGEIAYTMFLSLLGYGREGALCGRCSEVETRAFFLPDQTFLCGICASPFSEREVVRFI